MPDPFLALRAARDESSDFADRKKPAAFRVRLRRNFPRRDARPARADGWGWNAQDPLRERDAIPVRVRLWPRFAQDCFEVVESLLAVATLEGKPPQLQEHLGGAAAKARRGAI